MIIKINKTDETLIPLGLLEEGEKGVIRKVKNPEVINLLNGGNQDCFLGCCCCRTCFVKSRKGGKISLEDGRVVEMKSNQPGQLLLIALEDAQIAMSRKAAMNILVQKYKVA